MTTVAEVLAAHQPEVGGFRCSGCKYQSKNASVTDDEEFYAHVVEAITAAGLVCVGLGAPDIDMSTSDIDKVAKAIWDVSRDNTIGSPHWSDPFPVLVRERYRLMAVAAIRAAANAAEQVS